MSRAELRAAGYCVRWMDTDRGRGVVRGWHVLLEGKAVRGPYGDEGVAWVAAEEHAS